MSKSLIKTVRNRGIAQDRLAGATYKQLRKAYGLADSTLSDILNKDEDVKAIIEQGTRELAARIPKAIDNYDDFLQKKETPLQTKSGDIITDNDDNPVMVESNKDKELREKVSTNLLNGIGIQGTRTPSVIQNIMIDNSKTLISPTVAELLTGNNNVIDVNTGDDEI